MLLKNTRKVNFNRCIEFIDKNNILNDKQYHSTSMPIMQLTNKIANANKNHETTIGMYLDLSKAFDTIDHNILLHKLYRIL